MRVIRRIAAVTLALLALAPLPCAAAPIVSNQVGGADYVSIVDACRKLGIRFVLSADGKTMTLERGLRRGSVSAKTREMVLDGVRVYLGDAVEDRAGRLFASRIDYEKKILPLWRPDLAGPPPRRPHIIVLDPGHGGWDPGTENKHFGFQEKKFTLEVALRLRPLLVAQGWQVILTRTRDTALALKGMKDADLDARSAIAVRNHADIFLSIHFDADQSGTFQGSEIFSLAPTHQWASDDWNSGPQSRSGTMASKVIQTPFPGNRQDAWNTILAHHLYTRMQPALHTADKGERIAHWRVLTALNCPGVLVEPAYLSNDGEALRIASPDFRQKAAESIAAGLRDYASEIQRLNSP